MEQWAKDIEDVEMKRVNMGSVCKVYSSRVSGKKRNTSGSPIFVFLKYHSHSLGF